jgi:hypothetical protein
MSFNLTRLLRSTHVSSSSTIAPMYAFLFAPKLPIEGSDEAVSPNSDPREFERDWVVKKDDSDISVAGVPSFETVSDCGRLVRPGERGPRKVGLKGGASEAR